MKISHLQLENPIILAPMAGITDLPYRRVMKRFGAGMVFTEMVSANGLIRAGRRTRELLRSTPDERPLGIQLFGDDPQVLARAAGMVSEDGDLLDINLGCPVNKVVRSGAGSALLRDPCRVGRIVAAVRRAVTLPLTVKLRSGWDGSSVNYLEVARIAVSEGADAVTLHPEDPKPGIRWTLRLGTDSAAEGLPCRPCHRQRRRLHRRGRPGDDSKGRGATGSWSAAEGTAIPG